MKGIRREEILYTNVNIHTSNMKKYKHKATGCIAIRTEGHLNYIVTGPTLSFNAPSSIIESGDDWEEVKGSETPKVETHAKRHDGVVFELRDIVRGQVASNLWEEGPILSFEWIHPTVYGLKLAAQVGIYKIDIDNLQKAITTTADGVSIFDATKPVFAVDKRFWSTFLCVASVAKNISGDGLYFSTKEARLDYIARNRPLLSLEDIHDNAHLSVSEAYNLTIKAKEKLKANDSNL